MLLRNSTALLYCVSPLPLILLSSPFTKGGSRGISRHLLIDLLKHPRKVLQNIDV
jgi:hypothetical protein